MNFDIRTRERWYCVNVGVLLISMQVVSKLLILGVVRTNTGFERHTSRSANNVCLLCEHGRSVPSQRRCSAVLANLFCCDFVSHFRKVTD